MDWLTVILTISIGILGYYYIFRKSLNKFTKDGILHEKPWPLVGNLGKMFFKKQHVTELVERTYRLSEDAEYVGFYELSDPIILIRSPDLIKNISVKNFDHFVNHRVFADPTLDPLLGKNLVGLQNDEWREIRNLLSPAFTGSKMKMMFKLMSNCGQNFVDYFIEKSANDTIEIDTKDAFTKYTNDVVATCAFGISVDSMRNPQNDFYILGKEATNFDGFRSLKFMVIRNFPKIAKFFNIKLIPRKIELFFENVVKETIETRDREGINRPDMIQLMMETRKNKSDGGIDLSIQDMTAQAFIFFFGGFESSATAMCFTAHEIAANPKVLEKLRDEVDKVVRETNGELTYEAINGMHYLDAVISEALRLHPVAPFLDRVCLKRFELPPALPGAKSVIIEPGQYVWFPAYSIHRDSKYFPDPEKFDPERFIGDRKNEIDPSTYFPFGQGPRMCIGNRFALLEVKVLIFNLLAKCHLTPSDKTAVPLELKKASLNMIPKGGFWLNIRSRNNSNSKQ